MQRLILLIIATIPGFALAQAAPCPAGEICANIPEPTTMALLASGAAAVGLYKYLTKKKD